MSLFHHQPDGPYRVVFSTRVGGVSEGPFASLNLGLKTDDEEERVLENRRLLCEAAGVDGTTTAMAWQVHGPVVERAEARGMLAPTEHLRCDGLWSDEPGQAMALVTADCFPIALCRVEGPPGLAVLHVGWRGLLAGIVESGARALGDAQLAAIVGPGIGPCCYEVGDEVATPFRERFGASVVQEGHLDLRAAVELGLREVGCERVEHIEHCTACEEDLFFSHRRDRGRTGRQGVIAYIDA
jgi:purine-nucleoside/S-methyl-5'-thioadenosine phosphorylase / adenosine deaminase